MPKKSLKVHPASSDNTNNSIDNERDTMNTTDLRIAAVTHGHTEHDWRVLAAVDPTLPARTQPREHAVRCLSCGATTFNQSGRCNAHYEAPAAARRYIAERWPHLHTYDVTEMFRRVDAGDVTQATAYRLLDIRDTARGDRIARRAVRGTR